MSSSIVINPKNPITIGNLPPGTWFVDPSGNLGMSIVPTASANCIFIQDNNGNPVYKETMVPANEILITFNATINLQ